MEFRGMGVIGDVNLSSCGGTVKVQTSMEWLKPAWEVRKETVSTDSCFPELGRGMKGRQEMLILGGFFSSFFFKVEKTWTSLNVIGKEPIKRVHS